MKNDARRMVTLLAVTLTAPLAVMAQSTVFNDTFGSGSTLDSTIAAPTANSTSYEVVSGKTANPAFSIGSGDMDLNMGSTGGNGIEVEALFANSPISLMTVGDYIELNVSFTDTAGILTGAGEMGGGLYNSGGSAPVSGGLIAQLDVGSANNTGGAEGWQGYVGQVGFTGGNSQINYRAAQTSASALDQDQDVYIGGSISSSKGYDIPKSNTHYGQGTAPSVTLTASSVYTESFVITLASGGNLTIANALYSGVGTGGTLLSTINSGTITSPLTTSYDALAFGWYETGSQATEADISQIQVLDDIQQVPEPTTVALLGGAALSALLFIRRRR